MRQESFIPKMVLKKDFKQIIYLNINAFTIFQQYYSIWEKNYIVLIIVTKSEVKKAYILIILHKVLFYNLTF